MLSFHEARERLLRMASVLGDTPRVERVALDDVCGRVAATDVVAPFDFPAFDHSSMDGYAVRLQDLPEGAGPWTLPVAGESRAGGGWPEVAAGTTARIFTGAQTPVGTDAVVMQEDVTRSGDQATFARRPTSGANIRRRGEDLRQGAVAIPAGTRLRPSHVAMAAACDAPWVVVTRRPRVTLIATGDELRNPGDTRRAGIPECNCAGLRAMARRAGAEVAVAPNAPDDLGATTAAFAAALASSDVVVSVGGVSVGDHDLVRPALEACGVELDFWRVAMKPGKPLALGKRGNTVFLGLPGNPASALVTFALFGLPLLRAIQGDRAPWPPTVRARAGRAIKHATGRTEFVRATVARSGADLVATPLANQSSGAITTMAHADALLMLDAERGNVDAGADVEVLPFEELGA